MFIFYTPIEPLWFPGTIFKRPIGLIPNRTLTPPLFARTIPLWQSCMQGSFDLTMILHCRLFDVSVLELFCFNYFLGGKSYAYTFCF